MKITKEGQRLIREHQRRNNPSLWQELRRDWREALAWIGGAWIISALLLWGMGKLLILIML